MELKKVKPALPAAKRALKKKAIAREYEAKRRELGLGGGGGMKRGIGFYLVLMFGMALIASLVFKQAGMVEKRKAVNTKMLFAQRSVDALAEALGLRLGEEVEILGRQQPVAELSLYGLPEELDVFLAFFHRWSDKTELRAHGVSPHMAAPRLFEAQRFLLGIHPC